MSTVLSSVLLDVPRAAVIWLALLGVIVAAVAMLLTRPDLFRAGRRIRQAVLPAALEVDPQRQELNRYAEEVAVAAERAAVAAQRHRQGWLLAQEAAEAAWQAYEAAEADLRRLEAAAVLPLPQTPQTPAEYADRERYLHRAALAAYWRRELSEEQLSDVFAHRNGWDPRLHPVEQELVLRRAVRDHLRARHQAAAERERAAWHDAELAAESARSLREEAFAAAGRQPEPSDLLALPGVDQPTAELRPVRPEIQGRTAVA